MWKNCFSSIPKKKPGKRLYRIVNSEVKGNTIMQTVKITTQSCKLEKFLSEALYKTIFNIL
jgi:hypothetical protein